MEEKMNLAEMKRTRRLRTIKDNNAVLILTLVLLIAFLFVDGYKNSFYNVLRYTAMYGPVCLGLGIVMITGNIDLSAGFQAGFAGVTSVLGFNAAYQASGDPAFSLLAGILIAIATGAVTGAINGLVIAKIGVPSLIATIASNYAFQGLVFYYAKSSFSPEDAAIVKLAAQTSIGGMKWLTPTLIIFVVIAAALFLWMYKTRFGSSIYVVGDNPEAAAFAGISVKNTVWIAYILCGILASVSGFFMVSNAGYAIYTQGNSLATLTISCCVIGGIKMAGGKGTMLHVVLGVLIMRAISQIMASLVLSASMVNLITGILLIVVLIIDRFTSNKTVE